MNITDSNNLHTCTSCQMCAAVCPKGAIDIQLDRDGFYRPILNSELCINCSLCTKVCYKYSSVNKTDESDFPTLEVWAATAKNENILSDTTSGGVADILAQELIRQGYICCGVVYNYDENRAENRIAQTREETFGFRGSKYIQSYTYPAFKELLSKPASQKIAVFGTPCHIFAVDQFLTLKKRREKAILIDFYCHGCPSFNVWKKYAEEKFKTFNKLSSVKFRSKQRGWGNYCIEAHDSRHCYISPLTNDSFYTLFFSDHILNESCHTCELRSTLKYTDIRLGDFWGKLYDFNKKGVSIVTPVTQSGKALFEKIKNDFTIRKHKQNEVIPYQSWGKVYSPDMQLRTYLLSELAKENSKLKDITKYYRSNLSFRKKLKMTIKNFILHLPPFATSIIKRIYH